MEQPTNDQPQRGDPLNAGPERESFGVYITDDIKGWVPVNRGRWDDGAGPVERTEPAE